MIELYVPKQVVIGPHEYHVGFDHDIRLSDDHSGQINHRKQYIKIDPCQPQTLKEVIFAHEVIHGICNVFSVTADDNTVECLANGLVMFLKENFGVRFNFEGIDREDD